MVYPSYSTVFAMDLILPLRQQPLPLQLLNLLVDQRQDKALHGAVLSCRRHLQPEDRVPRDLPNIEGALMLVRISLRHGAGVYQGNTREAIAFDITWYLVIQLCILVMKEVFSMKMVRMLIQVPAPLKPNSTPSAHKAQAQAVIFAPCWSGSSRNLLRKDGDPCCPITTPANTITRRTKGTRCSRSR